MTDEFLIDLERYGYEVVQILAENWPDQAHDVARTVGDVSSTNAQCLVGTVRLVLERLERAVFRGDWPRHIKAKLVALQRRWAEELARIGETEEALKWAHEVVDFGEGRGGVISDIERARALLGGLTGSGTGG